jgi:hypothetical protein
MFDRQQQVRLWKAQIISDPMIAKEPGGYKSAFDSAADLTGRSFSWDEHYVGINGRIRTYLIVWRTLPGYLIQRLVARFIGPNHC